jgi:hypothetical protein
METYEETRIEQPTKSRKTRPTYENVLAATAGLETRLASERFFEVLRNKASEERGEDETETVEIGFNGRRKWAVSAVCHALTATEDFLELVSVSCRRGTARQVVADTEKVSVRALRRRLEGELQ